MTCRYDLTDQSYRDAFAAFEEAVGKATGQVAFANICRCTQGNISQLLKAKSLLPERYVLRVEAATAVPRFRLRPDVYPPSDYANVAWISPVATTVACDQRAILQQDAAL